MKRILLLCSLYFIASLSHAESCPQPRSGYIFRVAAWGNHVDPTSQVRCYYYLRGNESIHYVFVTPDWYTEKSIAYSWGPDVYRYNLCVSRNTNVNECQFSQQ